MKGILFLLLVIPAVCTAQSVKWASPSDYYENKIMYDKPVCPSYDTVQRKVIVEGSNGYLMIRQANLILIAETYSIGIGCDPKDKYNLVGIYSPKYTPIAASIEGKKVRLDEILFIEEK